MHLQDNFILDKECFKFVKVYDKNINYNSGLTMHYKNTRLIRESELTRLLGKGVVVDTFLVDKEEDGLQIHEVLNNAIIVVYSFQTHKKITIFAPPPCRLIELYDNVGKETPEYLITKSEENYLLGYNNILNS